MTTATTADAPRASAPWHLWVVGILGLLWNCVGAYDYTMSHLKGEAYYRQSGMTDAQIAVINAYPVWMHGVWAVGVWFSVLGSILMLARSKYAAPAFLVSFLGVIMMLVYSYVLSDAAKTAGQMGMIMNVAITGICLLLLIYAQAMAKRGVLR